MAEAIRNYQKRVTDWFIALDRRRKITLGIILFVTIVALALLVTFMTRTNYVTLARGLSETEAGQITTKLDELAINWRSRDNASTIMVDEDQIDNARMQLALSGVTTDNGFTFEDVMDRLTFTQTTEEKNRMFLYQTKSELENALRTLENIEDARIIINVKESTSFLNLEEDVSSASVQLNVAPGQEISRQAVDGVENFVMTAIKGLTHETITIIDQNGIQLNATSKSGDVFMSGDRDELKQTIQNRLNTSITHILAKQYGIQNVSVVSNVVLDFDSEQTDSVRYQSPLDGEQTGLIRSSNVLKETVENGAAGGVAGTDSNTTDTPQYPNLQNAQSDYKKTQEIFNYEMNEIHQTIVKAPGEIIDMSIAIIINSDVLDNNTMAEARKEEIIKMVASASGARDQSKIVVSAVPFHIEPEIAVTPTPTTVMGLPVYVFAIILGIIGLLGIAAFVFVSRRRTAAIQEAQEVIEEQEELEEINTEFQDRSSPKFQIEKFIDSKPEAVAQLLQSWINED